MSSKKPKNLEEEIARLKKEFEEVDKYKLKEIDASTVYNLEKAKFFAPVPENTVNLHSLQQDVKDFSQKKLPDMYPKEYKNYLDYKKDLSDAGIDPMPFESFLKEKSLPEVL